MAILGPKRAKKGPKIGKMRLFIKIVKKSICDAFTRGTPPKKGPKMSYIAKKGQKIAKK
jgi:hypothetical protein